MKCPMLLIPYIIKPGDNIYKLARQFNTTVDAILAVNPYYFFIWQQIYIPIPQPIKPHKKKLCNAATDTAITFNEKIYSPDILKNNYSIRKIQRKVETLKYGWVDFAIWVFTADVEVKVSLDGLVSAQVINVQRKFDSAWASMNFKPLITSIKRHDDSIAVNVKVKFEGVGNKWSVPIIYLGQEEKYKWGPKSDTVTTFERNYTFYFEDIKDMDDFKKQETETDYDGAEYDEPTTIDSTYAIELLPLTSTNLSTSGKCKLQISVIKTDFTTQLTLSAAGVKVVLKINPKLGLLSATKVVTDDQGKAIVYYTSPTQDEMDKLDKKEIEVLIQAKENMTANMDSVVMHVRSEKKDLSAMADHDIMPSHKRYHNKITIKFNTVSKPEGSGYDAVIKTSLSSGLLFKSITDEVGTRELNIKLWPGVEEYCYYRWYGDTKLSEAQEEIVTVSIPEVENQKVEINISVGINLELSELEPVWKGDFISGVYHPYNVLIRDGFHPSRDLNQLFKVFNISPSVKVEQLEYKPIGFSDFDSDVEDIFSRIISHIEGAFIPTGAYMNGLIKARVKGRLDEDLWVLVDDFWKVADPERYWPGVTPSNRGTYRFKFILKWDYDAKPDDNSKETGSLTVKEIPPEKEVFYTAIIPTLRAYISTFTNLGIADTVLEISLKIREGKIKDAMFDIAKSMASRFTGKWAEKKLKIILNKRYIELAKKAAKEDLGPEQIQKNIKRAYFNIFPKFSGTLTGFLVGKVKDYVFDFLSGRKQEILEQWSLQDPWELFYSFVKGYDEFGFVVICKVGIKSVKAYNVQGQELKEVPDQVFGGAEENEVMYYDDNIIGIPFPLNGSINVDIAGYGQQGMVKEAYEKLGRLYIITRTCVKVYNYPTGEWSTTLTLEGDEKLRFEGIELERSPDISIGPGIFIDFDRVKRGDSVTIKFTAGEDYGRRAWIGIIPEDILHGPEGLNDAADITYKYIGKKTSGTLTLTIPEDAPLGKYQFRMFPAAVDKKEEVAYSKTFLIENSSIPTEYIIVHGIWETNFGDMVLIQDDNRVSGYYTWDGGIISGTMKNNVLVGTWAEEPTYASPIDAGKVELIFSEDSFVGKWGYAVAEPSYIWKGKRISKGIDNKCNRYRINHSSPDLPVIEINNDKVKYNEASKYYYLNSCSRSITFVMKIDEKIVEKNIPTNPGYSYTVLVKGKLPNVEIEQRTDNPLPEKSDDRPDIVFDVSGKWITNWGDMTLKQSGRNITGSYSIHGLKDIGKLSGVLSNNTIIGTWNEKSIYKSVSDNGKFKFIFKDKNSFIGSWGYNESYGSLETGYHWNGKRKKE
ncbi:MAG: LysM peptidoglycan-binding domain-containing protein [Halanaerobiales bacterium]|nr:LysM peptidoglycan-binding domain-containing protein [Halanaerobiales bacterium]